VVEIASIYGPNDGTYVIEFRTAAGETPAISIPASEATVMVFAVYRGR
jgi:hypothetical protein